MEGKAWQGKERKDYEKKERNWIKYKLKDKLKGNMKFLLDKKVYAFFWLKKRVNKQTEKVRKVLNKSPSHEKVFLFSVSNSSFEISFSVCHSFITIGRNPHLSLSVNWLDWRTESKGKP